MNPSKVTSFYLRSGIFGLLSMLGAGFNYILYPLLVHILSARDFGDFAAIIAISNQALGILLAFNIISIYLVKTQTEELARTYTQVIQKYLVLVFLCVTFLVFLISPFLNSLLKIQNTGSFLLLAVLLITAVPLTLWTGYLQGHKELIRVGIFNAGAALTRLTLAVLLAFKFGAVGAIWGVLGGAIAGLIILRLVPGVKLPRLKSFFEKTTSNQKSFVWKLKGYFAECILIVGSLSFLQNYDITLAKSLFGSYDAGIYSGVSVLSNALYYLSFLLVWVILPEIKINDRKNNRRVLLTAYKLLGVLAVTVISVVFMFKDKLVTILLGADFINQGQVLLFAALYQLSLVAITLYAFYLLVNRQRRVILLSIFVVFTTFTTPALFSTSPVQMIKTLWISLLVGIVVYLIVYWAYVFAYKKNSRVC